MPGIFLGEHVASTIPDVPVSPWPGTTSTWTGWDGSVWDLSTGAAGVLLVDSGVRGLGMPPVQRYTSTSPAVAGSRWRGSATSEREVFWPLFVNSESSSDDWVGIDRAFWATMHPDKPGTWTVTQPSGEARSLRCRFSDDGGAAFDVDPSSRGWALYGVSLVAEEPYWTGPAIPRVWDGTPAVDFFGGAPKGPPFFISPGSTVATATLDNPGDIEAFAIWTLTGPWTSAALGAAGALVTVPFSGVLGESLTVDTRPDHMTAITGAGVDRTAELGASSFKAIQPGSSIALSLALVGSGRVSAQLAPRYFRAW